MQVKELMHTGAQSCTPQTTLKEAGIIMRDNDCGVLPVLGEGNKVIGMITDRDICLWLATHDRKASENKVRDNKEWISGKIHFCSPEDTVERALGNMGDHQIRRLPVLDKQGTLQGVVSINDLFLKAKEKQEPTYKEVVESFQHICEHSHQA